MATEYGAEFYDTAREGMKSSAAAVVPRLFDTFLGGAPHTFRVLDVGCGEGHWGKEFENRGCEVLGLDGDYVTDPVIPFRPTDLTDPLPDLGQFDLVLCLEVAEHLPPERADSFVAELCSLAKLNKPIIFSAAIPGQGGTGHLNEQWPEYWVERFAEHGFAASGALRFMFWNDERVENWYRQNLIVFTTMGPIILGGYPAEVLPVVHPVLYDARR